MPSHKKAFTLVEFILVIVVLAILVFVGTPKFQGAQTLATVAQAQSDLGDLAAALFSYRDNANVSGVFPPAGGVAQSGWSPWLDQVNFGIPNAPNNDLHACSIIWQNGSFYDDQGDAIPAGAATPPVQNDHYDLRVMTSPIEAISMIPVDPFKNDGINLAHYDYFGLELSSEFVIRSLGPDGVADVGCEDAGFDCDCASPICVSLGTGGPGRRIYNGAVDLHFGCAGCSTLAEALEVGAVVYAPTNGTSSTGDIFWTSLTPTEPSAAVRDWEVYR